MKMPSLTNNLYKYQTSAGILIDRLGGTDDEYEFSDTEEHNNIEYGEPTDDEGDMIDLQATDNETETVVASNIDNDSSDDDDDSDDEEIQEILNRYKKEEEEEESKDVYDDDSEEEDRFMEEMERFYRTGPFFSKEKKKSAGDDNDDDDDHDFKNKKKSAGDDNNDDDDHDDGNDNDSDDEEEDRKMSPDTHKAWLAAEAEAEFSSPPAFLKEIKQEVDKENVNDYEDAMNVARQLDFNDGLLDEPVSSPVARKPMNLRWSNKKKATKKSSKAKKKFADVPSHYRNGKPVKGYTRRNGDRLDSPKDVKLNMVNGRLMTAAELQDQKLAFSLALQEKLKLTRGDWN